jgi:DNA-binding IclR family transcriptional regulator
MEQNDSSPSTNWRFLTNHAAVLLQLAAQPDDTVVVISRGVGLRERTVAAIIADLRASGYVNVERRGRQNHYSIRREAILKRAAHSTCTIGDLLDSLLVCVAAGATHELP